MTVVTNYSRSVLHSSEFKLRMQLQIHVSCHSINTVTHNFGIPLLLFRATGSLFCCLSDSIIAGRGACARATGCCEADATTTTTTSMLCKRSYVSYEVICFTLIKVGFDGIRINGWLLSRIAS